jgi:hypothetical protein
MKKEWEKPEIKDLNVEVGVLALSPALEGPPGEGGNGSSGEQPFG